ncbi:exopolysaccharide biosynthesis polyprenyl glycosylphosphotransferase [Trebonia sp.]|uniref:exopolysaccharide biosynthesis polyprenyl glycosylphosphotransferase n=1 Tax=Trebonia sp. TaxID=2767075 RepID=UPI0026279F7A|nr:exopolysaccharide biosynthesis polyprenyl glycosylphosphotransferase [Trebonia sp.]
MADHLISGRRALDTRRPGSQGAGGPAVARGGRLARLAALPAADATGLVAACVVSGAVGKPLACTVYATAVISILAAGGQHRLRICLRASDQAGQILAAAALPLPVLLAWLPERRLLVLGICSAGLVLGCRVAATAALRAVHRRGLLAEPAVVVGAGTFGAYVAELMETHQELGLWPAGFVDDGPPRRDLPVPTLGTLSELAEVVQAHGIGRVIVCFSSNCRDEDMVALLRASSPLGADVCVAPRLYELGMAVPRGSLDEIWGVPLIPLRRRPRVRLAAKRAFDLFVGLVLGIAVTPVVLALAVAVRLRSGPPVLFRQDRVTGEGRVAQVVKLRTLEVHGDPDTRWEVPGELCRPLGRWLRATHLDELPQLANVVRGDMSLVGPRPERPYFAQRFRHEVPRYADRTRMPAGLTGWAQVHGLTGDTSLAERVRFDNYYIEYWSPWLDAVILARTAAGVVRAALPSRPARARAPRAPRRSRGRTAPTVTVRAWP